MGNKLSDLNSHLFDQIERLGNKDLHGEELKSETERAKSMASVAKEIVNNSKLALDAAKAYDEMSLNAKRHVDGVLLENKQ